MAFVKETPSISVCSTLLCKCLCCEGLSMEDYTSFWSNSCSISFFSPLHLSNVHVHVSPVFQLGKLLKPWEFRFNFCQFCVPILLDTIKYGIAETFCFPSLWSSLNRTSHSVRATDTESKLISRMLNCRTCFCLTHSFTQLNLIKKKSKSRICKMLMAYSMIEYNVV